MKALKVEWLPQDPLSEIYQKTGYQFALLSAPKDGNKQACSFMLCRDFLQDAVAAFTVKGQCQIYGFRYKFGKHPPLDMIRTRMLVTKDGLGSKDKQERFRKELKAGQSLLNHYERLAGVSMSTMRKVTDGSKHVWRFRGPGLWMRSPFLISMYSFLVRIGDKVDIVDGFKDTPDLVKRLNKVANGPWASDDHDVGYLKNSHDKMHILMSNLDELLFKGGKEKLDKNYEHPTNTMHSRCGIDSLCRFNSPDTTLNNKFQKLYQEAKKK
jgi:hypothetical protein